MRTNTPLSELQQNILRYLLERDVGGSFYAVKDQRHPGQRPGGYIPWSPAAFLGHAPTSSESASLSKSLEALENRGLISRRGFVGKRKKTTHILFTYRGRLLAEGYEVNTERQQLERDQIGLGAALRVIDRVAKEGTAAEQADARKGYITVFELLAVVKNQLKNLE